MTPLRIVVLIAAFAASSSAADPPTSPPAGSTDDSCPITQGGAQNDSLRAIIPPAGAKYTFAPGGAGFVDRDGALGIKFGWERLKEGQMIVGGRRLDATAKGARAYISDGYGDTGFQPMYLVFPTPGCWEITGRLGDGSLTFVVEVEQVGDGPGWKFDGLDLGWRITMLPDQVWRIVRGQERPVRVQ